MAKESTLKEVPDNSNYVVKADEQVDELRKEIWSTIHSEKEDLPWADVAYVLGIVPYELMHHCDELGEED